MSITDPVTTEPSPKKKKTTIRLTQEDISYLDKLQRKLGLEHSQIIRLAIRRLADRLDL